MPIPMRLLVPLLLSNQSFTPNNLTNLVVWYDASDPSTLWQDTLATTPADEDADVVGRWNDKSGNYNVTQATTASKPTVQLAEQNGRAVLQYDEVDDVLTNTSFADFGDAYTVFAVCKFNVSGDVSAGVFEVNNGSFGTGFLMFHGATFVARTIGGTSTNVSIAGNDVRDGVFYLHTMRLGSGTFQYWQGGVSQGTASPAANTNTLNKILVGALDLAGYPLNGMLAELIIYSDNKTDEEKAQVETYLANKWGVALS